MPPHGRLSRTYVTPHVTLTSLSRPRSPTHGPRRPHAAGHGHVLGRDTDIMQTCHVTGTGRGGPTTLDIVRADGEREAIANAPAPACTRSRWSIRRHFDISPALAPVRSATTSCPPNVHPSTSLRPDPRSSLATSAYDASPRPDYTYDQRAVGVTSVYEDIRRLHDDTGDLLMQLRRRRRPIRPLRRCGQHVYDPRSTRHRIAARFSAPEPPTHFTHPCFCEPTNSQVLPIGPAVLMAGDRYTYAGNDPVNASDPSGLCRDWFDSTCDSQNAAWIVKSASAPGGLVRVNEKQAAGLLNSNHWSKGDIGPTVNSFDWSQPVYIKAVDGSVTWWRYSSSAKSPGRLAFGTPNVLTIPQVAVSVLDLNPRFNNASYFWALSPNTITVVLYGHIARSAGGAGLQIVAPEWANKIDVVGGPVHTWNSESLVSQYEQTPNPPSPGYGLSSDLGGGCTISV